MNVINRAAITISYKQPFIDLNNKLCPDMPMELNVLGESKTYLVKENFGDAEKVIKKHYKEIFEEELEGIWIDENDWPQKRDWKLFNEWFNFEISDWVMDLVDKTLE
jgi:hypothetical protein